MTRPNRELVAQWQDSAPSMRYEDWLQAEVGIQRELWDDIPEGDYDAMIATLEYLLEIIGEIIR
jgi:hypothetical protein